MKNSYLSLLLVFVLCLSAGMMPTSYVAQAYTTENTSQADRSAVYTQADTYSSNATQGIYPTASNTLTRDADYVIATGAAMPNFIGVSVEKLFVYRYKDGSWQQIPWQFDQIIDGIPSPETDFSLDEDDQLLFMASDTGDQASPISWISDSDSQQYPRYELTVTDPLNPNQKGWVYVYRSATLSETVATDYVDFDPSTWIWTGENYLLGIAPYKLYANRVEMNGSGVNILDRTKLRLLTHEYQMYITEDDLTLNGDPLVRNGRIRAWGNYKGEGNQITLIGYRSTLSFIFDLDFSELVTSFDFFRFSADLSPAAVGSIYYDANTNGVIVDGVADDVATTPATDWWQVSGPSGSVIQIGDFSDLGGTSTNYYKDDATFDPDDTGDGKSYSDCGPYMENVNARLKFGIWYYFLGPNQPNVGATYRNHAHNPLEVMGNEQLYIKANLIYLPFVRFGN